MGSFPGSGRSPREGNGNLVQYSCLRESHGQRSLVGYRPWGLRVGDDWESRHVSVVYIFQSQTPSSPHPCVYFQSTAHMEVIGEETSPAMPGYLPGNNVAWQMLPWAPWHHCHLPSPLLSSALWADKCHVCCPGCLAARDPVTRFCPMRYIRGTWQRGASFLE